MTVHQQYLSFEWDHKVLPKVFLCDLAKGGRREVFAGERIVPAVIRPAADGSGFYIAAPYSSDPRFSTATMTRLYFYDLAAGRHVDVGLDWANGLGSALGPSAGFETSPDGFITLLAAGARYLPARYVKSGQGWKRTDLAGEHVKNLFAIAVSRDAKVVVYDHSTPGTPSKWYRATLDGARLAVPVKLTDLNPAFKDKATARAEVVRWRGQLVRGRLIDGKPE